MLTIMADIPELNKSPTLHQVTESSLKQTSALFLNTKGYC